MATGLIFILGAWHLTGVCAVTPTEFFVSESSPQLKTITVPEFIDNSLTILVEIDSVIEGSGNDDEEYESLDIDGEEQGTVHFVAFHGGDIKRWSIATFEHTTAFLCVDNVQLSKDIKIGVFSGMIQEKEVKMLVINELDDKGKCEPETYYEDEAVVDGGWSNWVGWEKCSVTCGGGMQRRRRECKSPAPQNNGNPCIGDNVESRVCSNIACFAPLVIDGDWGSWSRWQPCTVTCGGGLQKRKRLCSNPSPQNGGKYCNGNGMESRICNNDKCGKMVTINGAWSWWSRWDSCSATCGGGIQMRRRECSNPAPQNMGRFCEGDNVDSRNCNNVPCEGGDLVPIDGGWSLWKEWEACPVSCGGGVQRRRRECSNPTPQNMGKSCEGDNVESRMCNSIYCGAPVAVNGMWGRWGGWDLCPVTCGGSIQSRLRQCNSPSPQNGGTYCSGLQAESRSCNRETCRERNVDGGWGSWMGWSLCSATCGAGVQSRQRLCNQPVPQEDGRPCLGKSFESKVCTSRLCKTTKDEIAGGWSSWGAWGKCSVTCGKGIKERRRTCSYPVPQNGGPYCPSDPAEAAICNKKSCKGLSHGFISGSIGSRPRHPVSLDPAVTGVAEWSSWFGWSCCSHPNNCGRSWKTRSRTCRYKCLGTSQESSECLASTWYKENYMCPHWLSGGTL